MAEQTIPKWAMDRAREALDIAKSRRHPAASMVSDRLIIEAVSEVIVAVQRETIERCAKVADEYVTPDNPNATKAWKEGYATAWIAIAIRALSERTTNDTE